MPARLSEAQKIEADGLERHAGARGRAEAEIAQRKLEAEAVGIEAKAVALAKYNEAATFLELAKMQIDAEREVRADQAKAMGSALSSAQIRMYGGGDGTVDTIRGLFTSGFGVGEALEGMAQSLPDGLRERFAKNGIRGLFGKPAGGDAIKQAVGRLEALVANALPGDADRQVPFSQGLAGLEAAAGDDTSAHQALALLKSANAEGAFDDVPFDKVWSLLKATTRAAD